MTVLIGTAGWAIAPVHRSAFGNGASALERYASRLNFVEINSSFYRPHQRKTYERWADSVPDRFRFSVKMPKVITHELALERPARPLDAFIEECSGLGPKLGAILVQLPPRLAFDSRTASAFFRQLRARLPLTHLACEPRHKSWLQPAALRVLSRHGISRVGADPSPLGADLLAGGIRYWRLHGSPHIYRSRYTPEFLQSFADHLLRADPGDGLFVVFDNTTQGHALRNALELLPMCLSSRLGDESFSRNATASRKRDRVLSKLALPDEEAAMARDILKTLESEHDELRDLFEKMDKTTERASKGRQELLEKIQAGLLPHATWEEKVFYPAFKDRADRDGLQAHAEAIQEHRAVELRVLPDLQAASPTTTEFAGRAKVLGEFVDHHASEEEKTMFKMARKMFTTQERADMDVEYERWKASPAAKQAINEALHKAAAAAKANPPPA